MSRHKNSSRLKELCRNQQLNVATKFRQSSMEKDKFYVSTKSFSVATLLKKGVRKIIATIHFSVSTKIKTESNKVVL